MTSFADIPGDKAVCTASEGRPSPYEPTSKIAAQRSQSGPDRLNMTNLQLNEEEEKDEDWFLVSSVLSATHDSEDTASSPNPDAQSKPKLTATNVRIIDRLSDPSAIFERLWRKSQSSKQLQDNVTRHSSSTMELDEPYGPIYMESTDENIYAIGAWANSERPPAGLHLKRELDAATALKINEDVVEFCSR